MKIGLALLAFAALGAGIFFIWRAARVVTVGSPVNSTSTLVEGAGSVLNNISDRQIDSKMEPR